MTETELSLLAAPAMIGLSSKPKCKSAAQGQVIHLAQERCSHQLAAAGKQRSDLGTPDFNEADADGRRMGTGDLLADSTA